jgi:hypothetical protein
MEDHNKSENISSRRIGLALAMVYRGEVALKIITQPTKLLMDTQFPLRLLIASAIMLLLGWGLRKRPMDEAYAFGFLPFFLLTTASYYYYVTRATLWVVHASQLEERKHRLGLGLLIGMELFSNWAESEYPKHRFFLIGTLAWLLFIYSSLMALWYAWESYKGIGNLESSSGGESSSGQGAGLKAQSQEGSGIMKPTENQPEPS